MRIFKLATMGGVFAGVLGLFGPITYAAESSLREQPVSIQVIKLAEEPTLYVDWGAVGATVPRSGEAILEERKQIMAYIESPEVQETLKAEQERLAKVEYAIGKSKGEMIKEKYQSLPQYSGFRTFIGSRQRRLPKPDWLKVDAHLLETIHLVILDAVDERQRDWAVQYRTANKAVATFVLGWENLKAVDAWVDQHPIMAGLNPISSYELNGQKYEARNFADRYGVENLPAVIRFEDGQMIIDEGLETPIQGAK